MLLTRVFHLNAFFVVVSVELKLKQKSESQGAPQMMKWPWRLLLPIAMVPCRIVLQQRRTFHTLEVPEACGLL